MDANDQRSLPELVSALTGDLADLVRKESKLVRTEIAENLGRLAKGGVQVGIGAALLLGAMLVLLQALVLALTRFMNPTLASLLVGVVVGIIGFLLVKAGAAAAKPAALAPDRAARQLGKDAQLVKGHGQ